jgi:hypothetical protein
MNIQVLRAVIGGGGGNTKCADTDPTNETGFGVVGAWRMNPRITRLDTTQTWIWDSSVSIVTAHELKNREVRFRILIGSMYFSSPRGPARL